MVFRALGYSLLHFEVAVIVAKKQTVGVQQVRKDPLLQPHRGRLGCAAVHKHVGLSRVPVHVAVDAHPPLFRV